MHVKTHVRTTNRMCQQSTFIRWDILENTYPLLLTIVTQKRLDS